MKVHFNLAVSRDRHERYALTWAGPTLAVAAIVLVWLSFTAIRNLQRAHRAEQSLAQVRSQEIAINSKEAGLRQEIDRPEYKNRIQKSDFVNQLISRRQFSLTDLTFKVSKLLPPSTRLNGLALASASV